MQIPQSFRVVEVGARDGLQNEPTTLPLNVRVQLLQKLADAGLKHIEAGAFVSPKAIPQMADSADVYANLPKNHPDVAWTALTPNKHGYLRAKNANAHHHIALFAAASEQFSQANTNCSIKDAFKRAQTVAEIAHKDGVKIRGYVSCVVHCPWDGPVDPQQVASICNDLLSLGVYEISLGDTTGAGNPASIRAMINAVSKVVPPEKLAAHFHDTYGMAVANVLAAMDLGVHVADSAVAGLGGCPYAPGASGNLATEDLLYMLHGMNIHTGVDFAAVVQTGQFISKHLKRKPASRVANAVAKTAAAQHKSSS